MLQRYFFRFAGDLLELDAIEMDNVLHYVLRDIPKGGQVFLELPGGVNHPPSAKGRKRRVAASVERVSCTVDHESDMLIGDGLGSALLRHLKDSPVAGVHDWVIETVQSEESAPVNRIFRIYPPQELVLGDQAMRSAGTGGQAIESTASRASRQNILHEASSPSPLTVSGEVTVHMDEANDLLELLAKWPAVATHEVELHRQAVQLSLRSGFDELLSVKMLREITPFPHQLRTVERVLRRMRGRALLCDEVGLGKTIEAGIILTEYILRGLVKRALILTPPSLVEQWKEEVTRKLGLAFVCYDEPRFRSADKPWQAFDYIIASIDTAKRETHREQILHTEFDLVIVDEAHHLKNKSTIAWKFVNQLKKKYILLLTATPIENDMSELFNLITLLKPGQLLTEAEYKRRYVDRKDPLQPRNVNELKPLIQKVMIRNRRSTTGVIQSTRTAENLVIPPDSEEQQFYTELSRFVKAQLQGSGVKSSPASGDGRGHTGASRLKIHPFVLKNLLRQAGSSVACTLSTLHKLFDAHSGLSELELHGVQNLITLGELLASSTKGESVNAKKARNGQKTPSAKMEALWKLLMATPDQTVVFTGFVETQQAITEFLRATGLEVVNFHGGMSRMQKEQAISDFRAGAKVLVSTESGGEGRNLQFCHRMINFDIPWNPMRIEQRIGRIHRIGQEHEVNIFNLAAKGTMEEHILRILDAKVNLFQLVVGELDMILGSLGERREFEEILLDLWVKARDESELTRTMDMLGDELLAAKTHYQKVQDVDDKLLAELIEE